MSKLLKFLYVDCANLCPKRQPPVERKRSSEWPWTTDDDNIIPQGRVGCGSLGDVYRVSPPRVSLKIDAQYCH